MTPEAVMAIESILMVADQPVEAAVLAQLLEVPRAEVEAACEQLAAEYEAGGRGFILARVAGGYRFQSHPELAPYVERFVLDGQSSRLSSAALETLAIVAYKQPISRMQIAAIRGVNVDGVLRTLQQRGYVDEVDRDPGPGNAVLFGTTSLFLERVGLNSLHDLPPLADFVPGADVMEALEESLRPEPLTELAEEASALAEATAAADEDADEEAESLDPPAAEDEDIDDAAIGDVAVEDDAAVEDLVVEDPVVEDLVVEDDAAALEDLVVEDPAVEGDTAIEESDEVEDSDDPDREVDLRSHEAGGAALAATDSVVATLRHDRDGGSPRHPAPPHADSSPQSADVPTSPEVTFRPAPGAGTGGAEHGGIGATPGVGVDQTDREPSAACAPHLNRHEG